ncbi:hypothetical protein PVAND_006851 [Polypedilum vanderplanki]|uniref:Uncharacterized protein n=1 Tax=Polypedilum vanderplanki TaxID=319348 RepID=A0A9J6C5G3_POLVA|nr:hypothetical protein PVAND_006851 [Polypedilum vanderplanki]
MDLNLLVPLFMFLMFIIIISAATSRRCWNKCRNRSEYSSSTDITSQTITSFYQLQHSTNTAYNVYIFKEPPPPYKNQNTSKFSFSQKDSNNSEQPVV